MRLDVDPIACDAHGHCAELLPEAITLDEWGYPMTAEGELPTELEPLARRAVATCPTLALRLAVAQRSAPGRPDRLDPVTAQRARSVRPGSELPEQRHR